jgi:Ca-activated chloride channel homolog
MKKNSSFLLSFVCSLWIISGAAQTTGAKPKQTPDPWKNTRTGNAKYKAKDYAGAEKDYQQAVDKDSTTTRTSAYNLGNALYRQKKYADAERAYANSMTGENRDSLERAWYNLGNALFQQQKYEESVRAYKEALKLNPDDKDARYNMAYAQSMIRKQKPDNKKNKNDKKKNNEKKQPPKQDDRKKPEDQKNKNDQQKPENQMSKEEAQRMLDAMKSEEKKTRDRMNQKNKSRAARRSKDKDW